MQVIAERPTYGGPDLHVPREGEMDGSPRDRWLRIGKGRKWPVTEKAYQSVKAGAKTFITCTIHTAYDVWRRTGE